MTMIISSPGDSIPAKPTLFSVFRNIGEITGGGILFLSSLGDIVTDPIVATLIPPHIVGWVLGAAAVASKIGSLISKLKARQAE